jgi:hypothetical protein
VRRDHPLRAIRTIVNEALEALEREFVGLYGMPRGRNRRSRKEDTHDRNPGQPARHPARFTHLTVAGEYLHAPACAGMEDAVGAKSLGSRIVTCADDLVIPCRKRQSRRSLAATARSPARARRPRHAPTTRPVVPASTGAGAALPHRCYRPAGRGQKLADRRARVAASERCGFARRVGDRSEQPGEPRLDAWRLHPHGRGLGHLDVYIWRPPVLMTSTLCGAGIAELSDAIGRHRNTIVFKPDTDPEPI